MRRDASARAVIAALLGLCDNGMARSVRYDDGTSELCLESGERFLFGSSGVTRLPPLGRSAGTISWHGAQQNPEAPESGR